MIKYSDRLTKDKAESLAKKLKAEDSKLRKKGGKGNYSEVEVRMTFDGPGRKEYGVFVAPLANGGLINPSQIEEGMWVVEDTQGKPLGVYPANYKEEAMQEIGQGFADQYREHVIVARKGEEFEHAHYFPKAKKNSGDPLDRFNDLNKQGFMRDVYKKKKSPKASKKIVSCDACQDWHREGEHTKSRSERKKNPSTVADAKALAEKWHGRPAEEIFEVVEKEVYDTNLAVLGELVEMTLLDEDGYGQILKFDKSVLLVGTVDENNMEFVGGDQSLPLEKLGVETKKHKVNLGQVFSIVYWTDKHHLQGEPKKAIEREHEFNEESKDGNYPELVYDTRNEHMELVGGSYVVTPEGIRD